MLPLRIYYEDTDAAGIVYYANWLRFRAGAAAPSCFACSAEHRRLARRARCELGRAPRAIDYLKPARLDETIEVVTSCGELRGALLDMIQLARCGEEILVRAELVVARMGATGRPVRLPPHVRTALAQVSAGTRPAHATFRYNPLN